MTEIVRWEYKSVQVSPDFMIGDHSYASHAFEHCTGIINEYATKGWDMVWANKEWTQFLFKRPLLETDSFDPEDN